MISHRPPFKSEFFKKSQMSESIDVPSGCFADWLSIPLDLLTNCPFLENHEIWKNYFVYRHIYHTKQCTFLMRAKPFQDILFFNNNTKDLNLCFFFFVFFSCQISKKFKCLQVVQLSLVICLIIYQQNGC